MKIIQQFIEHKFFERFIISLIIINGITMWLETSKTVMNIAWTYLHLFDKVVITIFTIEAILKIFTYKINYFKNGWNLFDFMIVVLSLLPTSWPLQVIRIFRVFRLLRLVTIIPQMRKIVTALFSVIPGILSVSALLMLIYYIFAIMTTQLYWEKFPEWFWTLWSSFYTLFQIMTLESWSMWIVRPVMEIYPNAWILFVSFVLIATFIMVNLVIAIVVEAMNKINAQEEENIISSIEENQSATKKDIQALEAKIEQLTQIISEQKNSWK